MVAVSMALALVPPAVAFSPSAAPGPGGDIATVRPTTTTKSINSNNGMSLYYKNYHSSYYEYVDVDGDRMSLLSLLDPASVQKMESRSTAQAQELDPTSNTMTTDPATTTTSSSSRSSQRPSPIIQLRSIQDYHHHVLSDPNQLCVIRFSAPWCKVCKTTNVSWERMASKLGKLQTATNTNNKHMFSDKHKRIKFLSVSLDGKSDATLALKDMLQIKRVPTGILHHPKQGVFGKKVDLDRTNLSKLKKQLEQYMEEGGKMECVGRNLQSILER